ncbi:MAG: GNAT family protein [Spirochaetia bacterium]
MSDRKADWPSTDPDSLAVRFTLKDPRPRPDALAARASLSAIPFVTVLAPESQEPQVVGTTRFMSIDSRNRRMEIGATWIGKPWQRTRVNTEAKYLMLQFKTDSLNERSCAALLRIGAGLEGMLRERPVQ